MNTITGISSDITMFKFDDLSAESVMEGSVNNYFKSMKEIEAEFLSSMSTAKNTLKNMLSDISQFGHNIIYKDGDIQFQYPEGSAGYMEENY